MDPLKRTYAMFVIAGILTLIALGLPWFGARVDTHPVVGSDTTTIYSYNWNEVRTETYPSGNSGLTLNSYFGMGDYKTGEVFGNAYLLATIAGLAGLGVGVLGFRTERGLRFTQKNLALFGVIAALLMLAAPVYLAVSLPGAMLMDSSGCTTPAPCSQFAGSDVDSNAIYTIRRSWGPGLGWFLALLGAVIAALGALALRKASKAPSTGAAPYWNPQGQPGTAVPPPPPDQYGPGYQNPQQDWQQDGSGGQRGW